MNEKQVIWLLVLGLIPYRLERRCRKNGWRILQVEALFWNVTISTYRQRRNWRVQIPLIDRLRTAVWAAVMQLRK